MVVARDQVAVGARVDDLANRADRAQSSRSLRRPRRTSRARVMPAASVRASRSARLSCPAARRRRDTENRCRAPRDRTAPSADCPAWTRSCRRRSIIVGAAVVAFDHALGIVGRDPQVVIVSVRRPNRAVTSAAVIRSNRTSPRSAHRRRLRSSDRRRCASNTRRAVADRARSLHARPVAPAVVGAEHAPVFGFDHRPNAIRIHRRNSHAHASLHAARHPRRARQIRPRIAAVRRLPQARVRAAAIQAPRFAATLPRSPRRSLFGLFASIARSTAPALLPRVQNQLPGLSAVRRSINAALGIRRRT